MDIVKLGSTYLPKPLKKILRKPYEKWNLRGFSRRRELERVPVPRTDGYRYDYFIIWGHGLKYSKEIIEFIRSQKFMEIKMIRTYKVKNVRKLVNVVYDYDYAPLRHLKSKTRYLLNVNPTVCVIFVRNNEPREEMVGEGAFRHIECQNVKKVKNEIRNRFNPAKDGVVSDDHVVHASDNVFQVDYLLRFLGFEDGVAHLEKKPNPILSLPYHISKFSSFRIKKVKASQIYCRVLRGELENFTTEIVPLEQSPHYRYITGETDEYEKYLEKYGGYLLTDDHSTGNLEHLFEDSVYLESPQDTSYILVEEFHPDKYVILDGVHRASKLLFLQQKELIVAVKR
ncbi:MAG: hypothetical protein ACXQS1_00450 [Methermicoccaceae archaeon]